MKKNYFSFIYLFLACVCSVLVFLACSSDNNDELARFRRKNIGLIYQFYNLLPILNVEENITLPCDLDGKNIDKKKLDELLKTLGLENRKLHLPNELSGGQQQRVAIGRSLINSPTLILADEPTGNLDTKSSSEIVNLLKETNKKRGRYF